MTPSKLGKAAKYEGPPMINTKEFKLAFLKGDKDAVMYFDKKQTYPSTNQENLKGLQVSADRIATPLDNQRTSYIVSTMPDPATLRKCISVLNIL